MAIQDTQQTYSQHAVPQNIMDVEFKLIGDLTMRQFIYLMVFGLLAWLTFVTAVGIFRVPIAGSFVIIGLAMAFIPIQERGMDEWVVNFFRAISSPTQRVWKKETVLPPAFTYESLAVVRQEMITLAPTSSRRKLEDYLKTTQNQQEIDKLDIPEKEYLLKVRHAFAPVSTGVAVEEELAPPQQFESYKPFEPVQKQPAQPEPAPIPEQKQEPEQKPEKKPEPVSQPQTQPQPQPQKEPPKQEIETTIIKSRSPSLQPKTTSDRSGQPRPIKSYMAYDPITPDMHVGRRFTSTLPSDGHLVLPVKGEKVIATSEEIDIEKDIEEKTAQLRKLLEQVKGEHEAKVPVEEKSQQEPVQEQKVEKSEPGPKQQKSKARSEFDVRMIADQFKKKGPSRSEMERAKLEKIKEEARRKKEKMQFESQKQEHQSAMDKKDSELETAQQVVKDVKKENEALSNQIQKLRNDVNESGESEEEKAKKRELIEKLEQQRQEKSADYSALQRQILELQNKLAEKEKPQQEEKKVQPKAAKMEPITNEPNIVSGVIKKSDGEIIPGLVLLIKNNKGEAVRALKTNALGQFAISTQLVDGIYTLEVGSTVEDTTFDIITIEVKGEVIPPIELTGKET